MDVNMLLDYFSAYNTILAQYLFDFKKVSYFTQNALLTKFGFTMNCVLEIFDSLLYVNDELPLD